MKLKFVKFNFKPRDFFIGVFISKGETKLFYNIEYPYGGAQFERSIYICILPMLCLTFKLYYKMQKGM